MMLNHPFPPEVANKRACGVNCQINFSHRFKRLNFSVWIFGLIFASSICVPSPLYSRHAVHETVVSCIIKWKDKHQLAYFILISYDFLLFKNFQASSPKLSIIMLFRSSLYNGRLLQVLTEQLAFNQYQLHKIIHRKIPDGVF